MCFSPQAYFCNALFAVLFYEFQKCLVEDPRLLYIHKVGRIGKNLQLRRGYLLVDELCRRYRGPGIVLTHQHPLLAQAYALLPADARMEAPARP